MTQEIKAHKGYNMDRRTLKQNLKLEEIDVEITHIKHKIAEEKCEITKLQRSILEREEFLKSYEEEKEKVKSLGIYKYEEEAVNSLAHFLNSGKVIFGNNGRNERGIELYCREKVFVTAFDDHCREFRFPKIKWTSQFYSRPFCDFNIRLVKNGNKRYPNKPGADSYGGIFFMGVDIKPSES